MGKENTLEGFDKIVTSLTKNDRIAIIHDIDADGVSSGAITYNSIKLLRGKEPDLVITPTHKTTKLLSETIELLKEHKINKIICVDFALDQQPESIKETELLAEQILVIDHHKDYNYADNKKTFILKADYIKDIDPSKYPASKLVYDLFSRHVSLGRYAWLSSVGLMGDNQLEQWRPFVEEAIKKSESSIEELFEVSSLITSVEVLAPEKLNELLIFLAGCLKPKQVLESDYSKYAKTFHTEVQKVVEEFEEKKEVFGKQELIWFEFESNFNIKSPVINKVSNEIYPNKTVIFVQDKKDGFVSFSARRQDFKVKTNDLLEKCIEGFENAGAGGHIPASAGRIKKEDLPEFKKRILEALS